MATRNGPLGDFAFAMTDGQVSWKNDFSGTMDALERSITVRLVMASPLVTIDHNQPVGPRLDEPGNAAFDCFPVQDHDSKIIGAVYRRDVSTPDVMAKDTMRPLHDVPIIGSGESVEQLMRVMRETGQHHWLVLHDSTICGIVTRSDLARLPARLLLMIRFVRLEQLLADLIRRAAPKDEWLEMLDPKRKARIVGFAKRKAARNEYIDLLTLTTFSDKGCLLHPLLGRDDDAEPFERIVTLRNSLMHAHEEDIDEVSAEETLNHVLTMDRLIDNWSGATMSSA